MSMYHFHRVFKAQTGLTPKGYANAHRARRVRDELSRSATVTQAIYGAGFNSNSRFYESSTGVLGMTPTAFRAGGHGASIRFAIGECWLGAILVAASDKGICAIHLGDDPDVLARDLQDRFPEAQLIGGDAFQQRVWEALREIPPGSTASYAEIAERIGRPKSVRAVARACGANALAVAIPCHRVVRTDGSPSGYRWGVERKGALLRRERGTN
jgi:AraC family transcriptional regulator of adaptative response/methylated-DNA-[protein]-cysteine methyltransferase